MELIIVGVIVGAAAFFVGKRFFGMFKAKDTGCACGCSTCGISADTCEEAGQGKGQCEAVKPPRA